MKEPAWAGAGSKPGLLVWRVEHFHVVPVETKQSFMGRGVSPSGAFWPLPVPDFASKDPGSYGKFHKGDSYIVLQTVETDSGSS